MSPYNDIKNNVDYKQLMHDWLIDYIMVSVTSIWEYKPSSEDMSLAYFYSRESAIKNREKC